MTPEPPKRELLKAAIRPPKHNSLSTRSHVQAPISRTEISITSGTKKLGHKTIEFSSRAASMPFLDPAEMQRRVQADQQFKLEQKRALNQQRGALSHTP